MAFKRFLVYVSVVVLSYYWFYYIKQGPVYKSDKSLAGKTVLITGGNGGVGKAAAIEFAKRGARVVIASRNLKKSILAREEIIKETGGSASTVRIMSLDLENFASVRKFAKEFDETEKYLDILVNNAGVLGLDGQMKDKINRVFAINHLGPFLLTNLLMDKMKRQANTRPVRIINVSSLMYRLGNINFTNIYPQTQTHDGFFGIWKNYGDSKIANVYFTAELHRRFEKFGITAYSLHPGQITTDIADEFKMPRLLAKLMFFIFTRSPYYGCQTIMYCALDDDVIRDSGGYFLNCDASWYTELAKAGRIARALWNESQRIVDSIS